VTFEFLKSFYFNFKKIKINEILRTIKLINQKMHKTQLVRSRSVPNLNTSSKSSDISDINLSEDDEDSTCIEANKTLDKSD
jgi:hypothetical protein